MNPVMEKFHHTVPPTGIATVVMNVHVVLAPDANEIGFVPELSDTPVTVPRASVALEPRTF